MYVSRSRFVVVPSTRVDLLSRTWTGLAFKSLSPVVSIKNLSLDNLSSSRDNNFLIECCHGHSSQKKNKNRISSVRRAKEQRTKNIKWSPFYSFIPSNRKRVIIVKAQPTITASICSCNERHFDDVVTRENEINVHVDEREGEGERANADHENGSKNVTSTLSCCTNPVLQTLLWYREIGDQKALLLSVRANTHFNFLQRPFLSWQQQQTTPTMNLLLIASLTIVGLPIAIEAADGLYNYHLVPYTKPGDKAGAWFASTFGSQSVDVKCEDGKNFTMQDDGSRKSSPRINICCKSKPTQESDDADHEATTYLLDIKEEAGCCFPKHSRCPDPDADSKSPDKRIKVKCCESMKCVKASDNWECNTGH